MKKQFFRLLLVTIMMATSATAMFAVDTLNPNTRIANIIMMSREANQANGVFNPDEIFPGQILTFQFEDGTTSLVTVVENDNQWKLVDSKIAELESQHGPVVTYNPDQEASAVIPLAPSVPDEKPIAAVTGSKASLPAWLGWAALAVLLLAGAAFLYRRFRYRNPATAGPAMRSNGIERGRNEYQTVSEVMRTRFGGEVANIRRCRVTTNGLQRTAVEFADGTTQNLRFINEPCYSGMVTINGVQEERFVHSFCANAFGMVGNHMLRGNFTVVYEDEVVRPTEEPTQQQQQITATEQRVNLMVNAIEKLVAPLNSHSGEVSIEFTDNKLTVKVVHAAKAVFSENGKELVAAKEDVKEQPVNAS